MKIWQIFHSSQKRIWQQIHNGKSTMPELVYPQFLLQDMVAHGCLQVDSIIFNLHACWCNRSLLAGASMHSRQSLQSRNINCTIVLDLLLMLSSFWRLRYLLKRFQTTFRDPVYVLEPRFNILGTCFKFWRCKINFYNSVLSINFYTLIVVICATLDSCAIKTAYGVVKMRFWF